MGTLNNCVCTAQTSASFLEDVCAIVQWLHNNFKMISAFYWGGGGIFGVIRYSRGVLKGGYWKQARVIDFSSERQKNKQTKKGRLHYIRAYRGRDCIRLYIYQRFFAQWEVLNTWSYEFMFDEMKYCLKSIWWTLRRLGDSLVPDQEFETVIERISDL